MDDFDVEVSALATTSTASDAESQEDDTPNSPDDATADAPPRPARLSGGASSACPATPPRCSRHHVACGSRRRDPALPTVNRDAFLRLVTPPTPLPIATPQAGDDAFLWEHSVPWGRLFIDGKPGPNVSGSAVRQSDGLPDGAPFHLARGHHTIEYRASPFPTLKCVLTIPACARR